MLHPNNNLLYIFRKLSQSCEITEVACKDGKLPRLSTTLYSIRFCLYLLSEKIKYTWNSIHYHTDGQNILTSLTALFYTAVWAKLQVAFLHPISLPPPSLNSTYDSKSLLCQGSLSNTHWPTNLRNSAKNALTLEVLYHTMPHTPCTFEVNHVHSLKRLCLDTFNRKWQFVFHPVCVHTKKNC